MSSGYQSRRAAKREEVRLPVRINCHESETDEWEELTEVLNVSPFGALLQISRPTEPGRLLHLTLPMPRRIRCYDHDDENYRIWSLVRHIKTLTDDKDQLPHFEIGVAFVGKDCPARHATDPAERYDIASPPRDQPRAIDAVKRGIILLTTWLSKFTMPKDLSISERPPKPKISAG